jgi:FAD:protein FMN transferase
MFPALPILLATLQAAPASARVERNVAAMGTSLVLEVEHESRGAALEASERAVRAIEAVERRLSTWRESSELSLLNAAAPGKPVELSLELAADLASCARWFGETEGAFDPTVGPLIELWGLRGEGRIPSDEEVSFALEQVGFERVLRLDGRTATRVREGVRLEEGAFGKGVGLDAAAAELRAAGARATLGFGGQVIVVGEESEWGLADPRDRSRAVLRWRLSSGSIATTGNSEAAREVGGRRIGHVLDPRTGRPAADFGSVSVACESAGRADACSTAAFVLGPERALEWARGSQGIELVVIEVAGDALRATATVGLRGRVEALAPGVELRFLDLATDGTTPADGPVVRDRR